jgi:phenylpyruvate tautomerase PptA (4-oxalocrotonate tautomerase family)
MKSPKTKQDLIDKVTEQIESDLHCGFKEAIEELLTFVPVVNLIEYLPEEDWKQFKHLRDA